MQSSSSYITPTWPAPAHVKALTTVRQGGYSLKPFDSFNLALHVNDDPKAVHANREYLKSVAHLPSDPIWLTQVHGIHVIDLKDYCNQEQENFQMHSIEADASIAFQKNQVCAVLTADCLPILLCDKKGTRISAIHAGWKGLAAGIIQSTIEKLDCDPKTLLVWLGPSIGPKSFEVREDVFAAFKEYQQEAFVETDRGTWNADIYQLAREQLRTKGINHIFGGDYCTYLDVQHFYSYRRSNVTGRMASLIWMT